MIDDKNDKHDNFRVLRIGHDSRRSNDNEEEVKKRHLNNFHSKQNRHNMRTCPFSHIKVLMMPTWNITHINEWIKNVSINIAKKSRRTKPDTWLYPYGWQTKNNIIYQFRPQNFISRVCSYYLRVLQKTLTKSHSFLKISSLSLLQRNKVIDCCFHLRYIIYQSRPR